MKNNNDTLYADFINHILVFQKYETVRCLWLYITYVQIRIRICLEIHALFGSLLKLPFAMAIDNVKFTINAGGVHRGLIKNVPIPIIYYNTTNHT